MSDVGGVKNGYVVRCGVMRSLGVMNSRDPFQYGDQVVARTDRGTEMGVVLCEATSAATSAMESEPTFGEILRAATEHDLMQWNLMIEQTATDIEVCQRIIEASGLEMELVDVERIFGGEKFVIYYLAENRVDFRALVRDLAKQFRTRIEMRQIGVRDEAKLLADYGDCGQPVCCSRFLSKMPPVSMKMAKLQKATLDPTKISGRCGRLKCCLRYEYDTYKEMSAEMPPAGSICATRDGNVTVMAIDIMNQQLAVKTDDGRRISIPADAVLTIIQRGEDAPPDRRPKKRRSKS